MSIVFTSHPLKLQFFINSSILFTPYISLTVTTPLLLIQFSGYTAFRLPLQLFNFTYSKSLFIQNGNIRAINIPDKIVIQSPQTIIFRINITKRQRCFNNIFKITRVWQIRTQRKYFSEQSCVLGNILEIL